MKGEDGIYVNMYNDCRFNTDDLGERISVDVRANPYKCNGAKIRVRAKEETFTLALRVPEWAEGFSVFVNGERAEGELRDGYLLLQRKWCDDRVELRFKASVRMSVINGKIAFTSDPIAFARDLRLDDINAPVKK